MITDALAALSDVFSPPFRGVLLKSLALTLTALVALGVSVLWLFAHFVALPWEWAETGLDVVAGIGIGIGLLFLVAPASSVVAGLFLDDVAALVERTAFPGAGEGRPVPFARSVLLSVRFFAVVLVANLAALLLLLVPGVNLVIFLVVNAYLLGREYFELAAMRFRAPDEARSFRKRNGGHVFAAGLVIAAFVAIPFLNLATPLFATSYMVRRHRRLSDGAAVQPVLSG